MPQDLARGVYSAVATPFTADAGAVDEQRLRALVSRTVAAGIDGLVPCGSTGEFTSLSHDERRQVAEIVVDEAAGRVPVVVHTGAMTAKEAVALSSHAESIGADGALLVAPFYEPLGLDDIRAYYARVADAVTIPVGVYNLPVATGANLTPEWLADLAGEVPNLSFVKDTSGDLAQVGRLVAEHADRMQVFCGGDTLLLPALEWGANAIIGAPNIIAAECAAIADAVADERHGEALAMFREIFGLLEALESTGFYAAAVKAALELTGQDAGAPREPVLPLTGAARKRMDDVLARRATVARA